MRNYLRMNKTAVIAVVTTLVALSAMLASSTRSSHAIASEQAEGKKTSEKTTAISKAASYLEEALHAEQDRNYLRAAKYYKTLFRHEEFGERAVEGFVRVSAKLKLPDEPEKSLQELIANRNPFSPAAYLALSEIYSRQEKIEEALEAVAVYERLRPESLAAESLKISLLMRGEDFESAVRIISAVLKRTGDQQPELRHQRGTAYFRLQKYQEAANDLEFVVRSGEAPRGVHQRLLTCYMALNDYNSAEATARSWTAVEPKNPSAWVALGDAITRSKPVEAATALEKAASIDKDDVSIRTKIADIYYNLKDWNKAQPACREVLRLDTGNERAARQLVAILKSGNMVRELGRFLKAYASNNTDQVWASVAYVQALNQVGIFEPAAALADSAVMTKTSINSQLTAAYILVATGNTEAAAAKIDALAKKTPSDTLHYNLGLIYETARKQAEAIAAYEKIPESSGLWFRAQYNRALLLEKSGQVETALTTLKALQIKQPSAENVALKLRHIEESRSATSKTGRRLAAKSLDGTLPYRQWEFLP